ncbi:hypothetical protein [Paenibacillus polymyxa]|uniref:Uncharacterized protein n=1 Tax=Paenibacillus polymyxa (strain SC2) TaxID=886882 RepID=E3EL86_PAEPS|nr:hypothetical protein [Paenibacillus polymyxa]ADO59918.2 hypothetical protein PPSC2_28575 [Paenibacillus polymyxa SC2]WPQ59858.1 hypothetical protein SKN87_26590 [Paenibacillus polymyxa]
MSYSSLWAMNANLDGVEIREFQNPWLLSPIAWDILYEKYLPNEIDGEYGKKSFRLASRLDHDLFNRFSDIIYNCDNQEDRVIWEFSKQQIFFTKDKNFIAESLQQFIANNPVIAKDVSDHRFKEVAYEVLNLNQEKHPYFVFKNSSIINDVVCWFESFNAQSEEYTPRSLKHIDKIVADFVLIQDRSILGFKNNVEFCKELFNK